MIKSGDKEALKENDLALRIKTTLEQGKSVRSMEMDEKEIEIVKRFHLITSKPVMYVCNVDEGSVLTGNKYVDQVREAVKDEHAGVLLIGAKIEAINNTSAVNPVRDKEVIDLELQLKDLETVEKRIQKVEKQARAGDKDAKKQYELLSRYKEVLEQGKSARSVSLEKPEDIEFAQDLYLLTNKPVMYVCNVDESAANTGNAHVEAVRKAIAEENAEYKIQ